jgi:uncharacterized protein (TIGR02217 family)
VTVNFHDVLFPAAISFGSGGGPERRTQVVTLASGFEERNALWAHARRRYDAGLGLRSLDDLHAVLAFFEARMGRLYGFRWRDRTDWKSCAPSVDPAAMDCAIGVGDGVTTDYALAKTYRSGPAVYRRPIAKPVAGSVRVAVGGVELAAGVGFTVEPSTGRVTLASPPAAGVEVTAGFLFDTPVRFDTDRIEINLGAFEAGEIPSIPVVEVRL